MVPILHPGGPETRVDPSGRSASWPATPPPSPWLSLIQENSSSAFWGQVSPLQGASGTVHSPWIDCPSGPGRSGLDGFRDDLCSAPRGAPGESPPFSRTQLPGSAPAVLLSLPVWTPGHALRPTSDAKMSLPLASCPGQSGSCLPLLRQHKHWGNKASEEPSELTLLLRHSPWLPSLKGLFHFSVSLFVP